MLIKIYSLSLQIQKNKMSLHLKFTKALYILIICLFVINFHSFSQGFINPNSIKNIKVQSLSDSEISQIRKEMDKEKMSIEQLENLAITNGMSATDFATLKLRLENKKPTETELNVEKGVTISEKPIEMDDRSDLKTSEIFGSEIFRSSSMSFEPNPHLATPTNYILGPGDELQIVVFGMQEYTSSPRVSKEGRISIPVVGQIYVNGLSIEAAKSKIKSSFTKVFSSLNSGQSQISITLTNVRTIRITILGSRKPGNYSVSSLSTVFNALHIAGGPNDNGSYRKIELLRNNKIIKIIDIYKFLMTGDQSDNINLLDNDIIRIPVYENRVKIEGKVKRPGVFELLPNENFNDLLSYCSGFDEAAYKANIKLVQNTDKELKISDLNEKEYSTYTPKLGDVFKVSTILNRFENKVSIKGSVFRPDDYALVPGMTLNDLISKADGLTEDAFKNRALLIREKEDLRKEIEFINLNSNQNPELRKNDEVIISSIFDLKNIENVYISGYVKKPGEYPFAEKLTLYDLILQAGGFKTGASRQVEISRVIIKDEEISNQVEKSKVFTLTIDTLLIDQTKNFILQPEDVVQVRKKPVYEIQKTIYVTGRVMYPGEYVLSTELETFMDFIKRAGGLKEDANVESIYIKRKTDFASTEQIEHTVKKIPIDYKYILRKPNSYRNVFMKPGDQIIVEKIDNTVRVLGNVYLSTEIPYINGKRLKYYVNSVGGYNENTDKNRVYVVKPNGLAKTTKSFLFFRVYPKVHKGSDIIVPVQVEKISKKVKMTIQEIASITGVIGSLAGMTVAILNLYNK
ncbi:MAG: SLBB domain-containing protein [Flavobacteriia bacterium]|nr:SLBB domain-containing protein [Flavobacteriia bacterium]